MGVIVAERQGSDREVVAERRRRQSPDHRKTNWQRGRAWATSVLANTKSKIHQDTSSRARWRGAKVEVLTRGDLLSESEGEVSRGCSSEDACRKMGRAKGRSISRDGSTWSRPLRRETLGTRRAALTAASADRHVEAEPVQPGRVFAGRVESRRTSQRDRKP